MESKNQKTLASFVAFCKASPEQRFWQALRNWSKYNFVYGSMQPENMSNIMSDEYLEDTFYKE